MEKRGFFFPRISLRPVAVAPDLLADFPAGRVDGERV